MRILFCFRQIYTIVKCCFSYGFKYNLVCQLQYLDNYKINDFYNILQFAIITY